MDNFSDINEVYRQNLTWGMTDYLSSELGISKEALGQLGLGYYPAKNAFTIPERNHDGTIVGISYRFISGGKGCEKGSKRGLVFPLNQKFFSGKRRYREGSARWYKLEKGGGISCPICGKDHWCMVSDTDRNNPPAVNCCRVQTGSVSELGMGWLHILRKEENLKTDELTILPETQYPILCVEGMSDVAAAYDLGFIAIGRPAASAGLKLLKNFPLAGKPIIVVGERDSGAGAVGMEAAFRLLRTMSQQVKKVMPPEGIKDLRAWFNNGLTLNGFIKYVDEQSDCMLNGDVLESDVASVIAKQWLESANTFDSVHTVRKHRGQWVRFDKNHYSLYSEDVLRGDLYAHVEGKFYQSTSDAGEITIKPYKPSRSKISDVVDALNQWCPVEQSAPSWLDEQYGRPLPKDLIVFQNGILNVKDFINGKINLMDPTPKYFTFNALPYEFDDNAHSKLWDEFLHGVFDDEEQIMLLAEWMGYLCTPDLSFEKLMLFTGRPRSGKTTILDTIRHVLGPVQCAETSFSSLVGEFGFQPLMGKLVAMIGDAKTPRAAESDSALEKILQITGGDHVTVNKKRVDQLSSEQLYCRFTFAMNDLPCFSDHSRALESRLNILSFSKSFLGREDRSLKMRLREEAEKGKLIMFALEGLKRLRKQNQFSFPESSEEMLHQYKDLSVPLISFGAECLVTEPNPTKWTPDMWAAKDQIYSVWSVWAKIRGIKCGGKEQFGRWLQAAYPEIYTSRRRLQYDRVYGFAGLRLKDSAIKEYIRR
jgi:putative DNA primase/helicase